MTFLSASPDDFIIDEEESTLEVVELKFIQVKPGETLTLVLLRQHIIQVKKTNKQKKKPSIIFRCISKCLSQNITGEFSLPKGLMQVCL